MVSTPLKNISQIGSFPQVGVKIKNIWNHHLVIAYNITTSVVVAPWSRSMAEFDVGLLLVELSQLSHLEKNIDKALQKGGCQKGGCKSLALTDSYNTSYTLQQITFPYRYLTLGKSAHISGGHMVVWRRVPAPIQSWSWDNSGEGWLEDWEWSRMISRSDNGEGYFLPLQGAELVQPYSESWSLQWLIYIHL